MAKYLANTNTKEIHKLLYPQPKACKFDEMKDEHKIFLDTEYQVNARIGNHGYNGCAYCYPEKNTG